jgi:hypothetical protein
MKRGRELGIIKAALEGDIIRQKKSPYADKPEFKEWLHDSEKVLKKVSRALLEERAKQSFLKEPDIR